MSVYNRKLFFNRGGYAHRGTGIASGLMPVQNFQTGGQVDPMDKWRSAVYSGMMTATSKNRGPVGSFIDVMGQSMGAATEFLPDPKDIKGRKIIKGADGYQYYADTGERVLPDIVASDERKKSERYNTWLDTDPTPENPPSAIDLQTMGTFNEFLVKTEYIKPEKKEKHFWAVDIASGDDLRVTDTTFDSNTMKKGRPDRQGEGDKYIWVYNKVDKQMESIQNEDYDSKIHTKDPPKMEANDKYTTNYKDYLKTLENPDLATGPGFLEFLGRDQKAEKPPTSYQEYALTTDNPTPEGYIEFLDKYKLDHPRIYQEYLLTDDTPTPEEFGQFLDRNKKEKAESTSYKEYIQTTDNPTPQGYIEFLDKYKLDQPKSYQEYLLADDTPTTKEFGEFLDKQKKSDFTTDYKNYLNTLDSPDQATGPGFAAFLDKKLQKTQADKDYWVWSKEEGDYILIKGSEFDASKHSKEPLNQAMFLTGDKEFSQLAENKVTMMLNDMKGKINTATGLEYTNAEMNEIIFDEINDLVDRRLETLATEHPNVLSPEDQLEAAENIKDLDRRSKKIDDYITFADAKGKNAGGKLAQYQMLGMAKEDAIIGKVFQPQREWVGAMLNFLEWDKQENIDKMSDWHKTMIGGLQSFIGGNIASTDVVRALTALGTLANAENGALPGNLNEKEFLELKNSYATLFNSKEGFSLIVDLYQRDAQIDQMRFEALDNFLLTGKLEGRLFGKQSFEGLKDGEAVNMIKDKIQIIRDGMITGNEEMGWSDLSEQFDAVKSKGKLVDDWANFPDMSVSHNVEGVDKTWTINFADAASGKDDMGVQFLGYSDEDGKFMYQSISGPQEVIVQAGPNRPVYEINTGKVDNVGEPIYLIKGFAVQK